MAFNDTSKINISLKKLSGKAHTSNDKGLANEGLTSGITQASSTIFGEAVPTSPTTTNLYDRSGSGTLQVELVRFECEFITGTDTSSGRHAFRLKLPAGYEAGSSHGPAGAYVDSAIINSSNGALQLVPPSFGNTYEAKPFYGGSATKNSGTQIPLLDSRDWNIDYYNGILFQQDPPGTGDHSNNPDFVEAFLYIGKYLSAVVDAAGGTPAGSNTQIQFNDASAFAGDTSLTFNKTTDTLSTVNLTGSLTRLSDGNAYINAGAGVTITTGSTGAITINAGSGVGVTVNTNDIAIDNSIVATLTGSTFSGTVKAPALSGSLTHLNDGTSYMIAGSNITIATGSSGAVTISSSAAQNVFKTISVSGQDDVVADANTDTLNLAAGSNVAITTTAGTDTITIASTDTNTQLTQEQVEDYAGNLVASGGTKTGISVTYQDSTGDMDFVVSDLTVAGDSGSTGMTPGDTLTIAGGTNITTAMSGDTLTITGTDTNTVYTSGDGLDLTGTTFSLDLKANGGLKIDSTELSIDDSKVATLTGSIFSGGIQAPAISGSLTKLQDGSSYLVAGNNISITSASNGSVSISTAGGGTDLTGMQFITFAAEATLSNERILTAADGISISTANPQEIAISANRSKKFFDITGSHAADQQFDCHAMNFSTVNYNPDRIDVFLNGQSLRTGSNQDYLLQTTGSILFKMNLEIDDIVQVIIF